MNASQESAEEIPAGNCCPGSPVPIPRLHSIWGVLVRGWRQLWVALDPPEAAALHGNSLSQPAEVKFCTPAAPGSELCTSEEGEGKKKRQFPSFPFNGASCLATAASRGSVPMPGQLQSLVRRKHQALTASLSGAGGKTAVPGRFSCSAWVQALCSPSRQREQCPELRLFAPPAWGLWAAPAPEAAALSLP